MPALLHRATCPDPQTLGEFHLHLLNADQQNTIQAHLATCPHCQTELNQLGHYLHDLAAEARPSLVERVRVWIARQLDDGGNQAGAPALQPAFSVRGEANAPLLYVAGDTHISLEIESDPRHPDRRAILGLVLGELPPALTVVVQQEAETIATATVDDAGNFAINDLPPGQYHLAISGPTLEIEIQGLDIT